MISDQELKPLPVFTSLGVFFIVVLSALGLLAGILERHLRKGLRA